MNDAFEYVDKFNEFFLNNLEDFDDLRIYRFEDFDLKWLKRLMAFGEAAFGEDSFDVFTVVTQIYYGNIYLLREENDHPHILGLAAFTRGWDRDDLVYLSDFAISKDARGQAIGTQFLKQVLGEIKNQGFKTVRLTVEPDNDPAVALYKKLGFEIIDRVEDLYGEGAHRYIMEKNQG
ncbi:MAG: N-acetyltransferase [Tissierellia bacterium]|nr:N-acetyltransferase [Tissierellia bacterium]